MDLKRGAKAVQDLESNASKLSKLIPELSEVKKTLEALKKAETTGQKQLKEYEKNLSKLESQLTESIQLKLAEGLAEVSSRTKDLYDLSITESAKLKSDLEKLQAEILSQAKSLVKQGEQLQTLSAQLETAKNADDKFRSRIWKIIAAGVFVILISGFVLLLVISQRYSLF